MYSTSSKNRKEFHRQYYQQLVSSVPKCLLSVVRKKGDTEVNTMVCQHFWNELKASISECAYISKVWKGFANHCFLFLTNIIHNPPTFIGLELHKGRFVDIIYTFRDVTTQILITLVQIAIHIHKSLQGFKDSVTHLWIWLQTWIEIQWHNSQLIFATSCITIIAPY